MPSDAYASPDPPPPEAENPRQRTSLPHAMSSSNININSRAPLSSSVGPQSTQTTTTANRSHRRLRSTTFPDAENPPLVRVPRGDRPIHNIRANAAWRRAATRKVLALPSQQSASVLYAPDILPVEGDPRFPHHPYVATEFVSIDPTTLAGNSLAVRQNQQFEVRITGLSAGPLDSRWTFLKNSNELVLYSMQLLEDKATAQIEEGVPFIHYDHKLEHLSRAGEYQPISDAKSLVLRCGKGDARTNVRIRFKMIEIDDGDAHVRTALNAVPVLTAHLSSLNVTLPYLSVLTPAMSIAGNLGRAALDSFANCDKILEIDMDFRLLTADPVHWKELRTGDYLRFGWYFFLSEPVSAKLFASTTTARNVRLLTYSPQSRQYYPLMHVTYLVINVSRPVDEGKEVRPQLSQGHTRRLQHLCENAASMPPMELRDKVVHLMKEIRPASCDVVRIVGDSESVSLEVSERTEQGPEERPVKELSN